MCTEYCKHFCRHGSILQGYWIDDWIQTQSHLALYVEIYYTVYNLGNGFFIIILVKKKSRKQISILYICINELSSLEYFLHKLLDLRKWSDPIYSFLILFWYSFKFIFEQGIWLFSVITLGPVTYDGKSYPTWALGFGWCLGVASMLPIPILAFKSMLSTEGTCSQVKYTRQLVSYNQRRKPFPSVSAQVIIRFYLKNENKKWKYIL